MLKKLSYYAFLDFYMYEFGIFESLPLGGSDDWDSGVRDFSFWRFLDLIMSEFLVLDF